MTNVSRTANRQRHGREPQCDSAAAPDGHERSRSRPTMLELDNVSVFYGTYEAVRGTTLEYREEPDHRHDRPVGLRQVHHPARAQPDERPDPRGPGGRAVTFHGQDLYAPDVDPIQVRRRIGMVFQKPNPFPKSIYDNVAYGLRINGIKGNMDDLVEQALRGAALWDEVKDKLKTSGLALSGGQQQRLCIARTIAVKPEVILMDEPCSALDPIATSKIEDLMYELAFDYTIVIVTHNMQQAARVSHRTAFFTAEVDEQGCPARSAGRVRRDAEDLHQPEREADRGLHHRSVRVGTVGVPRTRQVLGRPGSGA